MEIDEIVDYATKSPENTNPAVLRSMLGQLSGGGSGGGGWGDTLQLKYDSAPTTVPANGFQRLVVSTWCDASGSVIENFDPTAYKAFIINSVSFNTALVLSWISFSDAITYGDPVYVGLFNPTSTQITIASDQDFTLSIFGIK